jgi:hypothetical protein
MPIAARGAYLHTARRPVESSSVPSMCEDSRLVTQEWMLAEVREKSKVSQFFSSFSVHSKVFRCPNISGR